MQNYHFVCLCVVSVCLLLLNHSLVTWGLYSRDDKELVRPLHLLSSPLALVISYRRAQYFPPRKTALFTLGPVKRAQYEYI